MVGWGRVSPQHRQVLGPEFWERPRTRQRKAIPATSLDLRDSLGVRNGSLLTYLSSSSQGPAEGQSSGL